MRPELDPNPIFAEVGLERILPASHRVALAAAEGERVLATVLRCALGEHEGLAARAPWDLPLVAVRPAWAGPEAPSILVELLPRGFPSHWLDATLVPLPFVLTLAERFVLAHAAGEVVGELHPALVFVDEDGELVACSQRPLRADRACVVGAVAAPSGHEAMFSDPVVTPAQAFGDGREDARDDVYRLAAMLWRYRRGRSPLGESLEEIIGNMARDALVVAPEDDFDRLCARGLSRDRDARPDAREILAALRELADRHGVLASTP